MNIHTLIYDSESFGITQKSLKMLRNALVDNLRDKILVLEISTSDILCGFLIVNHTQKSATWTGDGFRTDRGGEGGRGYKAATELLRTFGINKHDLFEIDQADKFTKATEITTSKAERDRNMMNAINEILQRYNEDFMYECVYERNPSY